MRKYVDHVLCGLSFEPKWYAERGIDVEFVGHPFFDEVAAKQLNEQFCWNNTAMPIASWVSCREAEIVKSREFS